MTDRIEIKAHLTATETGEITGIAWPFGAADLIGDTITKGAFDRPTSLPMLAEHDSGQAIGVWSEITETDEGLNVKGKLLIHDVPRAREIADQIKAGEIGGLSIGFVTHSAQRHQKGRTITSLGLREISIVKMPCNPGAAVRTLKSAPMPQEKISVEPELKQDPETKAIANDAPAIDPKKFDAIVQRLDKLEAKGFPGAPAIVQGGADGVERKAFVEYLQTGRLDQKALTNATDAAAGYVLAPKIVESEFIRNLVEFSPIRAIADVRTATGHTVVVPKRTGVTNAVWVGETAARTASEPTFGQQEITMKEMATFFDISLQNLEDSDAVLAEVTEALAEDFGAKESLAFVNGSTANEPQGFMTAAGVPTTNNGHATVLSADALIRLMYAQPAVFRNNSTWVMNSTTLATIRTLKDSTGAYIWQPSYQAGQPETILGRPVVEAKDMPNIAATTTPIVLGDFKKSLRIYDRVSLDILADLLTQRTNGLARFHARRRVGAAVVRPEGIRKLVMAV